VTVPPGWDLQLISHGVDGVDEWLVYDARTHMTLGLPPDGPLSRFHLVLVDHGWKPVAVTAGEIVYVGPICPTAQKALKAVCEQTIASVCFIERIRIAAVRQASSCRRRRR
jgi:hypothetical protein